MITVGLTGGIGMGKTTASRMLRSLGLPIFNADAVNHGILNGGAFGKIAGMFPESVVDGKIDRCKLGEIVTKSNRIHEIENITHRMVEEEMKNFIEANRDYRMVILDIPLLFESGMDRYCDYIITLECPDFIQEKRVLNRNNFDVGKFVFIKNRQMPKRLKRLFSDFVVFSCRGKKKMFQDLLKAIACAR